MSFENIQMPIARKKSDGKKIRIIEINEDNRYDGYECVICGSDVLAVAINGKKIDGENTKVTPHFKHKSVTKCTSESFIHYWMKTELINTGDTFKVITDKEETFVCNQIFFEKTIDVNGKKYRPDVTIQTSCGKTIYFEMRNTNGKNIRDYIDIWKQLNNIVVEVNISTLLEMKFDAIYYDGKYFNLSDEDRIYIDTIEKYRLTKADEIVIEQRKHEIEKLDYIWDNIRELNQDQDFTGIANVLKSIDSKESRNVAIDLIKKTRCREMLKYYIIDLKNKVDKKLKTLNLKYNGYLIRYETEIPRLIYDRVYQGIMIKLYSLDEYQDPYILYVDTDKITDKILDDSFKELLDNEIHKLKSRELVLKRYLDVLLENNKINNYVLGYVQNTDYVGCFYFEDYRKNKFIFQLSNSNTNISLKNYIDDDIKFIEIWQWHNDDYILIETQDSYDFFIGEMPFLSRHGHCYNFNKILKQDEIGLTFKKLNKNIVYLPRYDFEKANNELEEVFSEIRKLVKENFSKLDRYAVYNCNDFFIKSDEIDRKIHRILYPIIYNCEKSEKDLIVFCLNDKISKPFYYKDYAVKRFVEKLNLIGINAKFA